MTIGILPAAGKATRIHGLPKYLLPVPGGYLLERMANRIGVPCYIGANADNYDLLNDYKRPEDRVCKVVSRAMPETILNIRLQAMLGDENVLVGMPDTYWTDETVFLRLTDYLNQGFICAVAVFYVDVDMASRLGVCHWNKEGLLRHIEDKQPQTNGRWVWGAVAWRVDFWQYIQPEDAHLGIALQRAVEQGIEIPVVRCGGDYYDNGTPEDYFHCIRELVEAEYAAKLRA